MDKIPAIKVRGSNTMTVRTLGSKFTGSVNGTELFTVEDSGYAEGGYGFYTVKSVQAAFDNLKVWKTQPLKSLLQAATLDGSL
jgi:hypothetical protein